MIRGLQGDMGERPGRVVTFYSFKGGVGRTLTLANCAAQCASWGYRVLCVDWDLEAPGLRHYFEPLGAGPGRGVVDVTCDREIDWRSCVQKLDHGAEGGELHFIPAGCDDEDRFAGQLAEIDWNELYASGLGDHIERWRSDWIRSYDLVFLDSRTGYTDAGGICTAQLPDITVFLFAPNLQGLEGAIRAIEKARGIRERLPLDRGCVLEIPLPTRFDEDALGPTRRQWMATFLESLTPFYDQWRERSAEPGRLLEILRIPYKGEWAFGEPLPVRDESLTDAATISYRFAALAALLARGLQGSNELVAETTTFLQSARKGARGRHQDIFLSYPRGAADLARNLAQHLRRRPGQTGPLQVVLDEDSIAPGDDWIAVLHERVEQSRHMVVLLDQEPSSWQRTEVSSFQFSLEREGPGTQRKLLPVWLEDENSDPTLARLQAIRRSDWSTAAELAERIVTALDLAPVSVVEPVPKRRRRPIKRGAGSAEPSASAPESSADTALVLYRDAVASAHQNLIPFFPGATDRLLEEVYVELEFQDFASRLPGPDSAGDEDSGNVSDAARSARTGSRVGARLRDYLLDTGRRGAPAARLAVLGEPGSGKTTVARHLAHALAHDERWVPVFLPLAALDSVAFDPFDEAARRAVAEKDVEDVAYALRRAAEAGDVVLLLDGLDEVDPRRIRGMAERTRELAEAHERMPVAVLSRPIALERHELGDSFDRVRVEPLDDVRRLRLLRKLLGERDAARAAEALLGRDALSELVRNPLMLTLAALIVRESLLGAVEIPTRPVQLYHQAIELLLRRGHAAEPRGVRDRLAARHVLSALSLALHEQGREAWTSEELTELIWHVRKTDDEANFKLKETWRGNEDFLDDVGRNAGIIGPHDGPHSPWRYLHRSLREFLAADALRRAGPDERDRRIKAWDAEYAEGDRSTEDRPDPARWNEVYALFAGMVDQPDDLLRVMARQSPGLARRALRSVPGASQSAVLEVLELDGGDLHERCRQYARVVELVGDVQGGIEVLGELAARSSNCQELWFMREALRAAECAHPEARGAVEAAEARMFEHEAFGVRPTAEDVAAWLGPHGDSYWCAVPAGTAFTMGEQNSGRAITFARGYAIAVVPVTNARFEVFQPGFDKAAVRDRSDHPVVHVNWYRAAMFCAWAGLRLPSEAEWEGACRAGTQTQYWSGDSEEDLARVGWYRQNSYGRTHAVGQKPANSWGLYDVHGNVSEWCADDWDRGQWPDPDGRSLSGMGADYRILRGGSWGEHAGGCRSAYRDCRHRSPRGGSLGFRPAVTTSQDGGAVRESASHRMPG